jgi:hypothetical protein
MEQEGATAPRSEEGFLTTPARLSELRLCIQRMEPLSHTIQCEIFRVRQLNQISEGVEVGKFTFQHWDRKWVHPRRYVVVRQSLSKLPKASGNQPGLFNDLEDRSTYRICAMIINDGEATPEEIWKHYRPRAVDENMVKDLHDANLLVCSKNLRLSFLPLLVVHDIFLEILNRVHPNRKSDSAKTLRSVGRC